MKKKKIFITGINGQDGAYLSNFLIKKNYEIHGLLRRSSTSKLSRLDYFNIRNKIIFHHSELNEFKNIEDIIKKVKPDIIYNLAAVHITPGHEYHEYFETNIKGAENVCNFALTENVNTIVFISSIAPYGTWEDEKT